MRTFVAAALLLVSSLLAAQSAVPNAPTPTPDTFLSKVLYPATVLMFQQDDDGSMNFHCTATAIHHDITDDTYMFLTASHCLDMNKEGVETANTYYISPDERGLEKTFIRILSAKCGDVTDGVDLCLFFIKAESVKFPTVDIGEDPLTGEDVMSISAPAGIGKELLYGYVSSAHLDRPIKIESSGSKWDGYAVIEMPGVLGGSSGSAVVCKDSHKICAVMVGVYSTPQGHIQFAVPISRLQKVLEEQDKKKEKNSKK